MTNRPSFAQPQRLDEHTAAAQARILTLAAKPRPRLEGTPIHDALVAEREAANRPGVWRRLVGTDRALWMLVGVAVAALALLPVLA